MMVNIFHSIDKLLSYWLGGILSETPFLKAAHECAVAYFTAHRTEPGDHIRVRCTMFFHLCELLLEAVDIRHFVQLRGYGGPILLVQSASSAVSTERDEAREGET